MREHVSLLLNKSKEVYLRSYNKTLQKSELELPYHFAFRGIAPSTGKHGTC